MQVTVPLVFRSEADEGAPHLGDCELCTVHTKGATEEIVTERTNGKGLSRRSGREVEAEGQEEGRAAGSVPSPLSADSWSILCASPRSGHMCAQKSHIFADLPETQARGADARLGDLRSAAIWGSSLAGSLGLKRLGNATVRCQARTLREGVGGRGSSGG